jgi:hypothetical protein
MQGRSVTGFGFHERTLPFARDFELVDVLRGSLRHLPADAFPGGSSPSTAADLAWEIEALLARRDRAAARRYLRTRIVPILEQLADPHRTHLRQIATDLEAAL